jgi:hypothetical protein
MSTEKWPSPDADRETWIRYTKRWLQYREDHAVSADAYDMFLAHNAGQIERLRDAIKSSESGDGSEPSEQEQRMETAPAQAAVSAVFIDAGVMATLHYDALLEANAPKVPAQAENLLCHLVSPDRLHEVLGDFEEGYRLVFARHGVACARRWYRWQVFMVAVRGLIDAACKAAKVWSGFGAA